MKTQMKDRSEMKEEIVNKTYTKNCPKCDFENDDRSVSCFNCGVIMELNDVIEKVEKKAEFTDEELIDHINSFAALLHRKSGKSTLLKAGERFNTYRHMVGVVISIMNAADSKLTKDGYIERMQEACKKLRELEE